MLFKILKKLKLILLLIIYFSLVSNVAFAGSDLDRALSPDVEPVAVPKKIYNTTEDDMHYNYLDEVNYANNHKDFEQIIRKIKTTCNENCWIYHWANYRYYDWRKQNCYGEMPYELQKENDKDIIKELNKLKENINNRKAYVYEFGYTYVARSEYYGDMKQYTLALKEILTIKNFENVYYRYKDYVDNRIQNLLDIIANKFYEIPYNERKIIMPVEEDALRNTDSFVMLDIDNLPDNMIFPHGHPIEGELYVGHPFLPNKYFPIEDHELELTEDKIREFCDFVEMLGAIEVSVESISYTDENGRRHTEKVYGGNIEYSGYGVGGEYGTGNSMEFENELRKIVKIHEVFKPNKAPELAKNLYWYNKEPSWKRLYEKRMRGTLIEHNETISTSKSSMVQESEDININGELKILGATLGGKYSKLENTEYHQSKDVEIGLHVIFAPLEELKQFEEKK